MGRLRAPAHRPGARVQRHRRAALPRAGALPRRHAQRAAGRRPAAVGSRPRAGAADRRGARARALAGRHPPRPEAVERPVRRGRPRRRRRLRPGASAGHLRRHADRDRHAHGQPGVLVARAGRRRPGVGARRRLRARLHPLPPGLGRPPVRGRGPPRRRLPARARGRRDAARRGRRADRAADGARAVAAPAGRGRARPARGAQRRRRDARRRPPPPALEETVQLLPPTHARGARPSARTATRPPRRGARAGARRDPRPATSRSRRCQYPGVRIGGAVGAILVGAAAFGVAAAAGESSGAVDVDRSGLLFRSELAVATTRSPRS